MMEFRELIKNTRIDFIGMRRMAFALSGIFLLLGSIGLTMVLTSKANLSTDFTGGVSIHLRFQDPVNIGELRNALTANGVRDTLIQEVSGTKGFLIKTTLAEPGKEDIQDTLYRILSETWPGRPYEVLETNTVGPSVGQNLKKQAIVATVIAFVAIITYIGFRFNFLFGVAATFATFHDVLAMLGIFCVLGREINILFITALLTIAGYSLTDTIVVFDRIREHMAKMKVREDFGNVINRSINEVLSRTIVTNLTTFLVTVALALLGGSVLFDFALALMIGTVVGTYSSIFVASPLLFMWKRRIVGKRPSPDSGGNAKRNPYEISQT